MTASDAASLAKIESRYLARMDEALSAAGKVADKYASLDIQARYKTGDQLVTDADLEISRVLRDHLQRHGEAWLCEEDFDDRSRLASSIVWIVDPLDGTREFVDGVPEWAISVALAIDGEPIAGGVLNPVKNERFLGSLHTGLTLNAAHASISSRSTLRGATVLASRQEYFRGEWERFENRGFTVRAVGSVAYKLALVAAGLADATFTLQPKNEWDVAAGVALVRAAGGHVMCPGNSPLTFNRPDPLLPGLVAGAPGVWRELLGLLA